MGLGLGSPQQLCWPSGDESLASLFDDESGSDKLAAHLSRINVGKLDIVVASLGTEPFVVLVARVVEVLVDQDQATTGTQNPRQLADSGIEVGPVVHRVNRPGSIDAGVWYGELLGGAVKDFQPVARGLPQPTHTKDESHERGRVDCDHAGTRFRREDGTWPHPCADVQHSLGWPDIEQPYHLAVHR
jgi:hypothetical protein